MDIAVDPKFTMEAARLAPGARLVILENNGHWPNRQSPDRVNTLIAAFLAEEAPGIPSLEAG